MAQPPYGVPPGGYGAARPAAAKKSNALLWLGLGCAVLAFLGLVGGVAAWFFWTRSTALGSGPAGEAQSTDSLEACDRAMACCKAVVQKSSGDPTALAACDSLANVPASACEQALATYQKSASLLGISCE